MGRPLVVLIHHRTLLLFLGLLQFFFFLDNGRRHLHVLQMHLGSHLVQGVDGLVGESAVGDITFRQTHTRLQGLLRVGDVMMPFVSVFDVFENL